MPSLIFLAGPNAGRRYRLSEGDYIVGRRSDCQIFVPDMRVSRQHARIRPEAAGWAIEDLGSNNGTYINGERVQSAFLRHDDEITIANNRIRVEMPEAVTGRTDFDSHVTIVDLKNPAVLLSRDESESGQFPLPGETTKNEASRTTLLFARKLHALQSILDLAAKTTDPDELLASVVEQLLEVYPQAHSVGVLVEDEKTKELRVQCHKARVKALFGTDLKVPGTIIDHVVHDRRGVLLGEHVDPADAARSGYNGPNPAAEPTGRRMGAPLQAHGNDYGVVYVECVKGSFEQEDLDLLISIAAHAGLAIHSARMHGQLMRQQRLERDLRVARQIQRSLLRDPPVVDGIEFAVHYEPAYQIGGDFYDFIWHDAAHLAIVAGDVAGKAISAALYMARLTSELRSRAGIAKTPARLLRRVNDEMVKLGDDGMFATLVYCVYDLEQGSLVFTNAGHCVPLLRRGERVFPLHAEKAHIAPIGVMPDLEVGEAKVHLQAGDMLVLTSDGIHEARDAGGNEYGIKRLSRRIRTARGGAEGVVKAILQDVDSHVANGPQTDDMTIVAVAINERMARRRSSTIPGLPTVSTSGRHVLPRDDADSGATIQEGGQGSGRETALVSRQESGQESGPETGQESGQESGMVDGPAAGQHTERHETPHAGDATGEGEAGASGVPEPVGADDTRA